MFLSFRASDFTADFHVRQRSLFQELWILLPVKPYSLWAVDTCPVLDPTVLPHLLDENPSLLKLLTLKDSFGEIPQAAQPAGWRGGNFWQQAAGQWLLQMCHSSVVRSSKAITVSQSDLCCTQWWQGMGVQFHRGLPERDLCCLVQKTLNIL